MGNAAYLALEDGTVFAGQSFGALAERCGEVVFNTSMTGYQEILMDPSYKGQIVTMTTPHIGNYGVNWEDVESRRIQVEGFIVRELPRLESNWRSREKLEDFLKSAGLPGIEGIDTRALVRKLRTQGAMKGVLSALDCDPRSLVKKAIESPGLVGVDLVQHVTTENPYNWTEEDVWDPGHTPVEQEREFIVAYDFGIKYNILRCLRNRGFRIRVVPANTSAEDVLAMNPDGVFLSNGPGDPEPLTTPIENIRKIIGRKPIFGICLGHQLLGLAVHGKTFKLKFGHRGGNQPVKDLRSGKVEITSQNHGFCVDVDSIKQGNVALTHVNLNDQTVEGMECPDDRWFSVQYHPEASPGPHDARYLFDRFAQMLREDNA
ncbi:MAG TPA: glutamine-hydrolyzing carbamoyl-phosphate synthase small subunit [bacterium]|nr:glutamine-hydrolyzing carbamoyl-phosphate synthase small subunit [bacterium]